MKARQSTIIPKPQPTASLTRSELTSNCFASAVWGVVEMRVAGKCCAGVFVKRRGKSRVAGECYAGVLRRDVKNRGWLAVTRGQKTESENYAMQNPKNPPCLSLAEFLLEPFIRWFLWSSCDHGGKPVQKFTCPPI